MMARRLAEVYRPIDRYRPAPAPCGRRLIGWALLAATVAVLIVLAVQL
jgi:hypothetical protein